MIRKNTVKGHLVSTIFLSLDYRFGKGKPLLFETMVWDKEGKDIYQDRHATKAGAELAHLRIVNAIKYGKEIK